MGWKELSKRIYYKDGSLRDIYIHNTSISDWVKWIDYNNKNYTVQFEDRSNNSKRKEINIDTVIKYWKGENEDGVFAAIYVFGIKLMCYFLMEDEIELDLDPSDIHDISDHDSLISYLKDCSFLLQKRIVVTAEMDEEEILFKMTDGNVYFS